MQRLADNGENVRRIGDVVERTAEAATMFDGSLALER